MTDRFGACIPFVLKEEGGYTDNPADPGGATNCGITANTFIAWLDKHQQPRRPVKTITSAEVLQIYRECYWDVMQCAALPAPVDLAVFDFGVNAGPARSIKYLQLALGITADGVIGAATLSTANRTDAKAIALRLLDLRNAYYRQIVAAQPSLHVFLDGWFERVASIRDLINKGT
jgi:lysozyme family protein